MHQIWASLSMSSNVNVRLLSILRQIEHAMLESGIKSMCQTPVRKL